MLGSMASLHLNVYKNVRKSETVTFSFTAAKKTPKKTKYQRVQLPVQLQRLQKIFWNIIDASLQKKLVYQAAIKTI